MADFKSGARGTAVRGRNADVMIAIAKAATDAEVQATGGVLLCDQWPKRAVAPRQWA